MFVPSRVADFFFVPSRIADFLFVASRIADFFLWRSCAGVLRGHVARVLRLTFRYVLRRVLRDLARLIFRWLTFSVKHSSISVHVYEQ